MNNEVDGTFEGACHRSFEARGQCRECGSLGANQLGRTERRRFPVV
jgi:hypothetical protein